MPTQEMKNAQLLFFFLFAFVTPTFVVKSLLSLSVLVRNVSVLSMNVSNQALTQGEIVSLRTLCTYLVG